MAQRLVPKYCRSRNPTVTHFRELPAAVICQQVPKCHPQAGLFCFRSFVPRRQSHGDVRRPKKTSYARQDEVCLSYKERRSKMQTGLCGGNQLKREGTLDNIAPTACSRSNSSRGPSSDYGLAEGTPLKPLTGLRTSIAIASKT